MSRAVRDELSLVLAHIAAIAVVLCVLACVGASYELAKYKDDAAWRPPGSRPGYIWPVFGGDGHDGDRTDSADATLTCSWGGYQFDDWTINTTKTITLANSATGGWESYGVFRFGVKGTLTIEGTLSADGKGGPGGTGGLGAAATGRVTYAARYQTWNTWPSIGEGIVPSCGGGGGGGGVQDAADATIDTPALGTQASDAYGWFGVVFRGLSKGSSSTAGKTGPTEANDTYWYLWPQMLGPGPGGGGGGGGDPTDSGYTSGAGGNGGTGGNGGGCIIIEANAIAGAGTITADGTAGETGTASTATTGGNGGGGGGGGGGQVVVLYRDTSTQTWTITVAAGSGGVGATAGTGNNGNSGGSGTPGRSAVKRVW